MWSTELFKTLTGIFFQKYENDISQKEIFVLHFLSLHYLYQSDLFVFFFFFLVPAHIFI